MSPALMPTYARTPVAFERGEGAYLFDSEGRRYLDFGAGIAVNALGHAHPHLVSALSEQATHASCPDGVKPTSQTQRVSEPMTAHVP